MNEQDFSLIDNYFNGLLSPEEAQAVEARAAANPAFGQEFALRREMESFPRRAAQRQAFANTLATVEADYFQESALKALENQSRMTARVTRMRWLAAAASLALVAAAVWFFTSTGSPSYRQYAMHDEPSFTIRGAADEAATEAEKAFSEKNYAAALAALDRLLAAQPDDPTALLYKGICLIELDRLAEARALLEPMASGNTALRAEARWYIALSFLKEKNNAACRSELLKIAPGESRYEEAQGLLKKLGTGG
ncbi:MAG TPA: tetratricopeptide repeat protein [Saprospiraceae bacterium]|nr:tetratricopeptide repeat protein [Saprospiraceae bacterium]